MALIHGKFVEKKEGDVCCSSNSAALKFNKVILILVLFFETVTIVLLQMLQFNHTFVTVHVHMTI